MSFGFDGPWFEAALAPRVVAVAVVPGPAFDGRGWKYFALVKSSAISFEPTTCPLTLTNEPSALSLNADLADRVHGERVDQPEQHREHDEHGERGEDVTAHQ